MSTLVADPQRVLRGARQLTDAATTTLRTQLVDRRLPLPPDRLRRARPFAEPPRGSDLRPVMGDPGPPLVGWTFHQLFDLAAFGGEQRERYGDVWWGHSFGTRIVTVGGPVVEQVLVNRDDQVVSGPAWTHFIGPFFPDGLMLLDGDRHRHDRRIMQHAFTRKRLGAYLAMMQPVLRDGLATLAADRPPARPDGTTPLYPVLKDLTLDVALSAFMGLQLDADEPADVELREQLTGAFVATVRAATGLVRAFVPGTRWHRGREGRRVLEAFLAERVAARRGVDGDDLLTVLCNVTDDDGSGFTDEQVVDHMVFLLMAAHDTSTITLTAMLHDLAQHTDWQERCRTEVDALAADLAAQGRPDGPLTLADVDRLEALDLVMKESMRLLSPVPALFRVADRDLDLDGRYVPEGTLLTVAIQSNHLHPDLWDAPQRFDPERFAPHRREDRRHPGAYLPFGTGMHKCIGMHFGRLTVLTAMYELLRTTRVTAPAGYAVTWDRTSLPVPIDGLPLLLSAR